MESIITNQQSGIIEQLSRKLIFTLFKGLQDCGITVEEGSQSYFFGDRDAALQAVVKVNDSRLYSRVLSGGSVGYAEAYVEGDWETPDLTAVIRVFCRNMATLEKLEKRLGWITYPWHKLTHVLNKNTREGSRSNIAAHYDLGNDMYQLMLDPHMQYSSAIYPSPEASLVEAQEFKLKRICDQLELKPEDHLIEIGTGWGGLACYAAKHYGCRVTTTTLSQQQYNYTQQQVKQQGLEDRVTLLLKDYRDLDGQYDKLVSVEMIEAVGHQFFPSYFKKLEQLLKDDGRMLIQAITISDQRYDQYRKSVDFIQRYIFPGGCLPSVSEMTKHLKKQTSMTVTRLTDYGHHYAQTITDWTERFHEATSQLVEMGYDMDFQRLWDFYLAYCEGGFREGTIGLVHFEAAKPGARICLNGSGHS